MDADLKTNALVWVRRKDNNDYVTTSVLNLVSIRLSKEE